ncbi:class I SAM-dependent methyltransferase [Antarcticimicrobium luteum]|uniref:Class I SAM-dependent methyltransferase n=1 Tax=Antarcticimicrobium luteum TaxID=2547397 RepID=A0A4R5VF76_9RHOB|nr:class I SAM-dependent methyltransferase [Antarcticimicrobium luteum]TDK50404.1 class I SAM-dependent methyltransferase [Antarcticimicrobium luteum]
MTMDYEKKVQEQINQYANNALRFFPPDAHKYWMRNYMTPKMRDVFGVDHFIDMYLSAIPTDKDHVNILSIGSGDGQLELALAQRLIARGQPEFTIHVTELSDIRQQRTRERVAREGLQDRFEFHIVDFNRAFIPGSFDMMFAHHVLHHIVELEFLFDQIAEGLAPDGVFATIDMIGRNGHMRWPEALEYTELAWEFVPEHWKYNFQFNAFHEKYLNFDCSKSGFEGIRAQDILPLLIEKFDFSKFVAGGGFMDVIFDRGYGQSIDMANPGEKALVDFLSRTNELLLETDRIKPTMIFAHMTRKADVPAEPVIWGNMTPGFAVRPVAPSED